MKTAAETNRLLLKEGLVSLEHVRAWADSQIMVLEEPPYWLIAVSMAKSSEDVLAALIEVPGVASAVTVWRALTREWLELLEREPDRDSEIAKCLYFLGMEDRSPIMGLDGELMSFWDAIDLARDGVFGSREEERERMRVFLVRQSADLAAQPGVER